MRKMTNMLAVLFMASALFMTSCSTTEEIQRPTITESLTTDQSFTEVVSTTVDVVLSAMDNQWIENSADIRAILDKAEQGPLTALDKANLETLLGMSLEDYGILMEDMSNSYSTLLQRYPSLEEMAPEARQAIFASALESNPEVAAYFAGMNEAARACLAQDICNLVVDLARLIGGPLLCDVIANAVPVIGPLLCNIVIDLAVDILRGICSALPC